MRIIITGGTGLIGRALMHSLAQDGYEVIILSRSPRQSGPVPQTVRFVQWDGKTADGWGELADGAEAIVNLAGANIAGEGFLPTRWTPARKKLIIDSRVFAGKAVTEAAQRAQNKPKVIVQASAVGYYGARGDEDLSESAPPGKDFTGESCQLWEASTQEVEAMGVRRVVIRTGVVLSGDGGALPRMALPFKLFAGGPLGSGKQQFSWIHIADEVKAIRFLIENSSASGPYNLTAPNPLTNRDFARILGRVLGRPSLLPTPGFAFKIMFGEVSTVLLDGQRVVPARLLEAGFRFDYPEAENALRAVYAKP